jgi:hypothetical protein
MGCGAAVGERNILPDDDDDDTDKTRIGCMYAVSGNCISFGACKFPIPGNCNDDMFIAAPNTSDTFVFIQSCLQNISFSNESVRLKNLSKLGKFADRLQMAVRCV